MVPQFFSISTNTAFYRKRSSSQSGIIVVFTLIAVVLLLIASVALVRSFDTSLNIAGNMGFKRDLVNQSERGIARAVSGMSIGGALADETLRQNNAPAENYSATTLASDLHGIPNILINDNDWAASGTMTMLDITDTNSQIRIRYVIDRLCVDFGPATPASCAVSVPIPTGGSDALNRPIANTLPVYRISVRIRGPRNTQSFVQSSISQ
jgi:type IV pilus assembly protein PilX